MSGEQVLRVILVKQFGGFSYDELAERYAREPKQVCFDGGFSLQASDGTSPNEFLVEVGPRRTLHRVPAGT
jgi:hypothetical protein